MLGMTGLLLALAVPGWRSLWFNLYFLSGPALFCAAVFYASALLRDSSMDLGIALLLRRAPGIQHV